MKTHRITTLCMLIASIGCALGQAAAADEPEFAADAGSRFQLRLPNARFDVGPNARNETEGAYQRTVGERGAFLLDTHTGATMAVLSSAATPKGVANFAALPKSLTSDPDRHNAEARKLLEAAGVPFAEVAGTHVTTTMAGGGMMNDGVQPSASTFLWYTTHLERALQGIPVEGSFAYAALDADGQVITEGAYWPAIPGAVVRRALALKERLAAGPARQAFADRLRAARPDIGNAEGEVKIVHTGAGHHGAFDARAVYSVVVRSLNRGKAQILRFDDAGAPVQLADELPAGADSPKVR